MANINDIVNVNITIDSPASDPISYSRMLIVTDLPTGTPTATMPEVLAITSAADLVDYGYIVTSPAYKAAAVAFAQDPMPDLVYVTARQMTDDQEPEVEEIETTLNRAKNTGDWYGFVIAGQDSLSAANVISAATWAETNMRMFGYSWTAGELVTDISAYNRTFAIYAGNATEADGNTYMAVAWMAKCFGYDNGSETWAFKTLALANPSSLTNAETTVFKAENVNYYQTYAGRNLTMNGVVGSGEWIDIIRFRDWLVNQITVRFVNFFATNTKVAFTDAGITGVQNVIESILQQGQAMGGISPSTFDDDGNEIPGYTIKVPLARNVSASDKKQRRLTNVSFSATLAGAIHFVRITGRLTY